MSLTIRNWIEVAVVLVRFLFLVATGLFVAKLFGALLLSGALTLYYAGHPLVAEMFAGVPFVWLAWLLVAWIRQSLKQQAEDRLGIDWRKTG